MTRKVLHMTPPDADTPAEIDEPTTKPEGDAEGGEVIPLPESLERADLLEAKLMVERARTAQERVRSAELALELARNQAAELGVQQQAHFAALREKYKLADGDEVEINSGRIVRGSG